MPFENLEFVKGQSKSLRASISYKRQRTKNQDILPRLTIGIPGSIVGDKKPEPSQAFALQLGSGKDAGRLRIVPVSGGGVRARSIRSGLTFFFGHIPLLGADAAEKEFVEARALPDGKGFELDLPAWFKADEA